MMALSSIVKTGFYGLRHASRDEYIFTLMENTGFVPAGPKKPRFYGHPAVTSQKTY
jgi:hypothetical protein